MQIGHRESIDFDLFTTKPFTSLNIRKRISEVRGIDRIIRDEEGQYTVIVNKVYFTFFEYPFEIEYIEKLDNVIKMPNLLTLGAMKLHALGRRAKWKDYVDLYFILKDFHSMDEITKKATKLFGDEFNEKIVREQLSYFDDIDYRQKVNYKKGFETDEETIKKALTEFSLA